MDDNTIDSGDQVIGRRRRSTFTEGVEDTEGHHRRAATAPDKGEKSLFRRGPALPAADDTEDTEGHVTRTYPSAAPDGELDCRIPLPGEEDERRSRL